jgi:hypothetical protein
MACTFTCNSLALSSKTGTTSGNGQPVTLPCRSDDPTVGLGQLLVEGHVVQGRTGVLFDRGHGGIGAGADADVVGMAVAAVGSPAADGRGDEGSDGLRDPAGDLRLVAVPHRAVGIVPELHSSEPESLACRVKLPGPDARQVLLPRAGRLALPPFAASGDAQEVDVDPAAACR